MRNIKTLTIGIVGLSLLLGAGKLGASEIVGGFIDTSNEEMAVLLDSGTRDVLFTSQTDPIITNKGKVATTKGSLYVVKSTGAWTVSKVILKDKAGVSIALPTGNLDKVVFLDAQGGIRGGLGLDDKEIATLSRVHRVNDLSYVFEASKALALPDSYGIVEDSFADAMDGTAPINNKLNTALDTIEDNVSSPLAQLTDEILIKAENPASFNASIDFLSYHDNGGPGKGLISYHDNGGPGKGLVAYHDNGGPGKGLVAYHDNGGPGKGLIAYHDNGGPGKGLVVMGFDAGGSGSPQSAMPTDLNATTAGSTFMAF